MFSPFLAYLSLIPDTTTNILIPRQTWPPYQKDRERVYVRERERERVCVYVRG